MTNTLFDQLFAPHQDSAQPFIITPRGETLSYGDFITLSARLANAFESQGVQKGDRIAIQVDKSPIALAIYAACVRTGAALLPLNTAYTPVEVDYFVGDAQPLLLIAGSASAQALAEVAERHGAILLTLDADGSGTLADSACAMPDDHTVRSCGPDDLAAILYTSGTTGRSKGAMLSHNNLLSNARTLVQLWCFTSDDVLIHALPIFHTHGLFVAVNCCLLSGAAMRFHEAFDSDAIIMDLPRATTLMGVPTFYTRLLQSPRLTRDVVSSMRLFVSGSAPLLAETHDEFAKRTGHRILERYGMTETNMNTSNPYDGERKAGTVGLPLPGTDVFVTDPATRERRAQGEIGMIEVRGPNVFSGYWRMPEKTAAELGPDGFFITGDLGRFDDELVIDEFDGVVESAVFGVPDRDFGEAVVAAVVGQPGGGATGETIMAALRPRLARFKQPKRIIMVDELPRNTMGKVQKSVLRDNYTTMTPLA